MTRALRSAAVAAAHILSRFTPAVALDAPMAPRRVGVLLQWGIGDAILAVPFLKGLKQAHPDASIELLGKPWLADLFRGEKYVDDFHTLVPPWSKYSQKYRFWQPDWREYLRQLQAVRSIRFDALVSLRWDMRDALQMRLLNSGQKAGFGAAGGRHWVNRDFGFSREYYYAMHQGALAAAAARSFVGGTPSAVPRLTPGAEARDKAVDLLRRHSYRGGPVLALHTEAGHPVRRWGVDRFAEVLRQLGRERAFVVRVVGPDDSDDHDSGVLGTLCDLQWQGGLSDLKGLLSCSDVLLGNDSGVMHMAAAVGCRVVGIFGSGVPAWFGPSGNGHQVVFTEPMSCRPCWNDCRYPTPVCLERVSVSEVLDALNRVLAPVGYR